MPVMAEAQGTPQEKQGLLAPAPEGLPTDEERASAWNS